MEYAQQSLALREKLGHKKDIADTLVWIGWIYYRKGEYDRAGEYAQQSLVLAKEFGHKPTIGWSLHLNGHIYLQKGELDRAGEYGQQCLALTKELGHKPLLGWTLNLIGVIYHNKGELDRALDYSQQSLALHKELGIKSGIATAHNNIGFSFMDKGELEQALVHLEQSLTLYEELGNKRANAPPLCNIGEIYFLRGEWDQAIAYLEQSLALFEEFGHKVHASEALYYLVSVAIDQTALEQARRYLQRLQQLNEQEDNKIINQRYRVAEALVLKTSPRALHRGKAEELLTQVVEEEIVSHEVTVAALLHLCDLLLVELRTSDAPEVLGEVQAHVTRLLEIAQQKHSYLLFAETYVLQAKLALVELDVQGARRFLEQAQRLAEEWGLQRLAMRISTEHDTLLDQLGQWEDFIDRNASLAERAELAHLEEQVVRMVRKRVGALPELPQEKPELLLIVGADSGLNVFSKSFREDRPFTEQLIAGFLTAINALVRDAFAATGSIERIKHQEHTLLLKAVEPFLVSYVFQGPSYFALQKLDQFTEALQASPVVWQALTEALQTRRFVAEGSPVEALVTEMFLTPAEIEQ